MVADLIEREEESSLSADEKAGFNHFMELEHIRRVASHGRSSGIDSASTADIRAEVTRRDGYRANTRGIH